MNRQSCAVLLIGLVLSTSVFANKSPREKCGADTFQLFSESELEEYSQHAEGQLNSRNVAIREAVKVSAANIKMHDTIYRDHKGEIDGKTAQRLIRVGAISWTLAAHKGYYLMSYSGVRYKLNQRASNSGLVESTLKQVDPCEVFIGRAME